MKNNFDIEEFYCYHDFDIKFSSYEGYITIYVQLTLFGEQIGRCKLYTIERKTLSDEDLLWFFDDLEAVASENFYDILTNKNQKILNRLKNRRFVYLTDMYIEPKYRNKGVGTIFIEDIENMLKFMRIKDVYLVSAMYEDNDIPYRNESFYLRNKFIIINDSGNINDGKMMYKMI